MCVLVAQRRRSDGVEVEQEEEEEEVGREKGVDHAFTQYAPKASRTPGSSR